MFVQLKKRLKALWVLVLVAWYVLWSEDPYEDHSFWFQRDDDSRLNELLLDFTSALVADRYMIALNQKVDDFKNRSVTYQEYKASKMADPEFVQAVQDAEPEYLWERVKVLVSNGTPPEDAVKMVYGEDGTNG